MKWMRWSLAMLIAVVMISGGIVMAQEDAGSDDAAGAESMTKKEKVSKLDKEIEKHAKRLANFDRIAELAKENGNEQLAEKVTMLRDKELKRHEKAMSRIQGGKGKSGEHGKPEGKGKPDDKGKDAAHGKSDGKGKPEGKGKPSDDDDDEDETEEDDDGHGKPADKGNKGKGKGSKGS